VTNIFLFIFVAFSYEVLFYAYRLRLRIGDVVAFIARAVRNQQLIKILKFIVYAVARRYLFAFVLLFFAMFQYHHQIQLFPLFIF
jgi:hypothetical protein